MKLPGRGMENFLLGPGFIDILLQIHYFMGSSGLRNAKRYNSSSGTHSLVRETDG